MAVRTYISIIMWNANGLNAPTKHIDWLNGYKKKTHMYDGYKRFTSDLGTDADSKWGDGKRYSFHGNGNERKLE